VLEREALEPELEELEPGLALVVALEVQVVGPVAVIPQGIIPRQVEQLLERRRRDRPGNQHPQHQQSASSSAQPHKSPGRFTSARADLCGFSDVIALGGRSSGVGYISEAPVPLRGLFDVSDGRALFRGRTRSFRFARRMG
jgi:hypothetical protein